MLPSWKAVQRSIEADIKAARATAFRVFRDEVFDTEAEIIQFFYSRPTEEGRQGLKRRTGNAARNWHVKVDQANGVLSGRIWNTATARDGKGRIYNYADHSKERIIKAASGKWLAIPSANAKTKAGVPRFTGPRDPKAPPMFFLEVKKGKTALLLASGKGIPKNKRLLFILKKQVKIPARTSGLMPFFQKRRILIRERVARAIAG